MWVKSIQEWVKYFQYIRLNGSQIMEEIENRKNERKSLHLSVNNIDQLRYGNSNATIPENAKEKTTISQELTKSSTFSDLQKRNSVYLENKSTNNIIQNNNNHDYNNGSIKYNKIEENNTSVNPSSPTSKSINNQFESNLNSSSNQQQGESGNLNEPNNRSSYSINNNKMDSSHTPTTNDLKSMSYNDLNILSSMQQEKLERHHQHQQQQQITPLQVTTTPPLNGNNLDSFELIEMIKERDNKLLQMQQEILFLQKEISLKDQLYDGIRNERNQMEVKCSELSNLNISLENHLNICLEEIKGKDEALNNAQLKLKNIQIESLKSKSQVHNEYKKELFLVIPIYFYLFFIYFIYFYLFLFIFIYFFLFLFIFIFILICFYLFLFIFIYFYLFLFIFIYFYLFFIYFILKILIRRMKIFSHISLI